MIDNAKKRFIERQNKSCDVWVFTHDEVRELIQKGKSPLTRAFLSLSFHLKDKDVCVRTLKFEDLSISDNTICVTGSYQQHVKLPDWVAVNLMEYLESKICEPENLVFSHPLDDDAPIDFSLRRMMLMRLIRDNIKTCGVRSRFACLEALNRAVFRF